MRISIKRHIFPATLSLLAGGAIVRAAPITVYDSGGFEPASGFSPASYGGDLYGQGNPEWVPDMYPPVDSPTGNGVPATVVYNNSYTPTLANGGTQSVELARSATSVDTRWSPYTYSAVSNPYNPVASGTPIIDINWDMDVASSGSNDLFGIELDNGSGAGSRISYVAVDTPGCSVGTCSIAHSLNAVLA